MKREAPQLIILKFANFIKATKDNKQFSNFLKAKNGTK